MPTLEFLGEDLVPVPASFAWISTKRFRVRGEGSDEALLAALLEHIQYADFYAGGTVDESKPPSAIHGPYERAAISVATFVPTSIDAARDRVVAWATDCALTRRDIAADATDVQRFLAEELPAALHEPRASVFELPDIRATAEHELGWVVGQLGFHEFIVIDRPNAMLSLVVASDD